jgi:hypothetical protein
VTSKEARFNSVGIKKEARLCSSPRGIFRVAATFNYLPFYSSETLSHKIQDSKPTTQCVVPSTRRTCNTKATLAQGSPRPPMSRPR